MDIQAHIKYTEGYLPTPRHKILRYRECDEVITATLREVDKNDLKLAFEDNSFEGKGEIYSFDGGLWVKAKNDQPHSVRTTVEELKEDFMKYSWFYGYKPEDTRENQIAKVVGRLSGYIVADGELYSKSDEPRYCIYTFGLGHNHGGTHLAVTYMYNSNISKDRYFSALDGEKAVQAAIEIATNRGDTESIDTISADIVVHNPEAVTVRPEVEHGDGDEFLGKLEDVISGSSDSMEAGLLALLLTGAEMNKPEPEPKDRYPVLYGYSDNGKKELRGIDEVATFIATEGLKSDLKILKEDGEELLDTFGIFINKISDMEYREELLKALVPKQKNLEIPKEDNQEPEKHIIWSNINLDLDDWKDDLKEQYPDKTDDELYSIMCETNAEYLSDERANLDIQLAMPIIIIADLGLWNGRVQGYKDVDSGNISDCLYSENDYTEWYVDDKGDFRATDIHHDGTNYYLYRVFKDNVTDEQIEDFKEKIWNHSLTQKDIDKYTRRLGDDIAKVYGFDIPKPEKSSIKEQLKNNKTAVETTPKKVVKNKDLEV